MKNTKEGLERILNSSPLFEIDKEKDYGRFIVERNQFLVFLWEYCALLYGKRIEQFGLEVMEVADNCISKYDKSKGEFINFFNKLLKIELRIQKSERKEDDVRHGIKISDGDRKAICKIIKIAKQRNLKLDDYVFIEDCAEILRKSPEVIAKLIELNACAVTISNIQDVDDDGQEIDIFDTIAADVDIGDEIAFKLDVSVDINAMLNKISGIYLSLQNRANQRKLFAMWITSLLIKAFVEVTDIVSPISDEPYFSKEVADFYCKTGKIMGKRQMAEIVGVKPESASRCFSNFVKLFQNNFKEYLSCKRNI